VARVARLTSRPTQRVTKALRRAGWQVRPGRRGAKHHVMVNPDRPGIVTIPRHAEVKMGTLRVILRAAGLSPREFENLYK
jgi:predicted RNA binding protein YcfA (HicA-like mRNA interferase family)